MINTLRRELATAAAPAATTTTATTTNTLMSTKTAGANKATTPTSRAALSGSWRDGTPTGAPGTPRRSKLQLHPGAPPPTLPQYPCVWTGTVSGQRSLEHPNGCLCRSGHVPVHPFAS